MENNNTTTYWILGIVAAILLGGGFFIFYKMTASTPSTNQPISSGTDTNGGGGNSTTQVTQTPQTGATVPAGEQGITVSTLGGGTLVVRDFKNDPATQPDPNNDGQYYLAGGLDPTAASTPYSTFFVQANQSFNITLLREPIKDVRLQAETELLQKLGISQDQACSLNYSVAVPDQINSIYSGKNLGFSFCPGATQL